jgi:hypothetical protein
MEEPLRGMIGKTYKIKVFVNGEIERDAVF